MRVLRLFGEHGELQMVDDMLALANSVGLPARLSRSDRHVLALLLCAGLIALCCLCCVALCLR